jgi:hypothetical protein
VKNQFDPYNFKKKLNWFRTSLFKNMGNMEWKNLFDPIKPTQSKQKNELG